MRLHEGASEPTTKKLEAIITESYGRFAALLGSLRGAMAARHPDFAKRKRLWYEVVDSDVLELLEQGRDADALARIREITGVGARHEVLIAE